MKRIKNTVIELMKMLLFMVFFWCRVNKRLIVCITMQESG